LSSSIIAPKYIRKRVPYSTSQVGFHLNRSRRNLSRSNIYSDVLTDEKDNPREEVGKTTYGDTENNFDKAEDTFVSSINDLFELNPIKPSCDFPPNFKENGIPNVGDDDSQPPSRCLILMDSFCPYHGKYLHHIAKEVYGVGIISVLSTYVAGFLFHQHETTEHLSSRAPISQEEAEKWKQQIPFDEIVGIYCESDSGLAEAEKLGKMLGLSPSRCNRFNEARRNKFLMNECVSNYGLNTVKQRMCTTVEEALDFARDIGVKERDDGIYKEEEEKEKYFMNKLSHVRKNDGEVNEGCLGSARNLSKDIGENGKYCVVKPFRGVASGDVYLCSNLSSIESSFKKIHRTSVFGSTTRELNDQVLVQEFAYGTEYALDIVSRDGEHKVAALWCYDKRPVNNSPFVYHATELVDAKDSLIGEMICDYATRALDALEVNWGMSHVEVIVDHPQHDHGPRLVEVNCRQHNTDFAPLTTACVGYNALDMFLAAYLGNVNDDEQQTGRNMVEWDDIPTLPKTNTHGAIVHLVSHTSGILKNIQYDKLYEIESLPSVVAMEIYPNFLEVGSFIEKTVDIRSDAGWAHLINEDEDEFKADYERIVELMPLLFEVESDEKV